jgi:hypothetical protein
MADTVIHSKMGGGAADMIHYTQIGGWYGRYDPITPKRVVWSIRFDNMQMGSNGRSVTAKWVTDGMTNTIRCIQMGG